MSPLAHEEIQELLGAYALDAVEPAESDEIERHLEACPRCRAEVEGHREVATMLGNSGGDAPEGLWDRIADQLEDQPPPMRLDLPAGQGSVVPLRAPERGRPGRVALAVLGAAAVLAVAVLGAQVVRQQDRLDDMDAAFDEMALEAAAFEAFNDPEASTVDLRSSDGSVSGKAVVLPDGSGYLLAGDLPGLAGDRTYQLWGDTGTGSLVSLGVLGDDPTTVAFSAGSDLTALAITDEEAGGVVQSKRPPVIAGTFD